MGGEFEEGQAREEVHSGGLKFVLKEIVRCNDYYIGLFVLSLSK